MEYICYKRFKDNGMDGYINLPRGSEVEEVDGIIASGSKAICKNTSQAAYEHFARNNDNQGLQRGDLIIEIKKILSKRDNKYQTRWNKLWADKEANKLRMPDHQDFWCWGFQFYNATIEQLNHIKDLIANV